MKLRSGSSVEIKSTKEDRRKKKSREKRFSSVILTKNQINNRPDHRKCLNEIQISDIIENSRRLIVRMDRAQNLNAQAAETRGENSENSDSETNGGARTFDAQTIAAALAAPLPTLDDDDDNERETQQQQQPHALPQNGQPQVQQQQIRRRKMAELLERPKPLKTDGNVAENWKRFRRQMDTFMTATELSTKSSEVRAAVVLNLVGQDAMDVFDSLGLTNEQKKDYDEVLKAFDDFCKPKKNELYERYVFNKRDQKEGESFDTYLMDLRCLVRTCGYGVNEETMLRDRIVFGIFDDKLRKKLLETQNLTYANTVEKCRADEATCSYAKDMKKAASIDEIKRDSGRKNTQQQQSQQQHQNKQHNRNQNNRGQQQWQRQPKNAQSNERQNQNKNANNNKVIENCTRCTRTHRIKECPAYGKMCNKCSGPNHFSSACRVRKVNTVAMNDREFRVNLSQEFNIDSIEQVNDRNESDDDVTYPWVERMQINGTTVPFKVDSGAEIDVLPLSKLKQINNRIKLHRTDIKLRGFDGNKTTPIGMCLLAFEYDNMTFKRYVAIVDSNVTPILGLYSAVKFGIITIKNKKSVDTIGKEI